MSDLLVRVICLAAGQAIPQWISEVTPARRIKFRDVEIQIVRGLKTCCFRCLTALRTVMSQERAVRGRLARTKDIVGASKSRRDSILELANIIRIASL
jgi:bacterioferritin-associated ferredoxin